MAKKKKLKVLTLAELESRQQVCVENNLCFISKEELRDVAKVVPHPELKEVRVNPEWL